MAEYDIFNRISQDLGIPRGIGEADELWHCRLAYSAAAWRGLTSLWEHEEGSAEKNVSMHHILNTIGDTLTTFGKLFPHVQQTLTIFKITQKEKLSEHIRDVLHLGGSFYHKSHRAAPVPPASAVEGRISFLRGLSPASSCRMCGAGLYRKERAANADLTPHTMFGLLPLLSEQDMERFEASLNSERRTSLENREFLQLDIPRLKNGYWKDTPDKGVLSLLRRKEGDRSYALYRFDGNTFSCRFLPEYWNKETRYAALASSLLAQRGLTLFKVEKNAGLFFVKPGYLLPPAENAFFHLYSWPDMRPDMGEKSSFSPRIMDGEIYPAFYSVMTRLGYRFMETEHV